MYTSPQRVVIIDTSSKEGRKMSKLKLTKTAKISKIQVFSGKTEAQDYFNILGSLDIDVESFFIGVNDRYEHVYFIDEILDFEELESLLKGYRIKMIVER